MNEQNERELDLLDMWKILKKRKWLIICTAILCTVITAAMNIFVITPVYEAVTRIVIVKENAKLFYEDRYTESDVLMYQQLAKTYTAIAMSDSVIDATAKNFNQYPAGEIRKSLSAASNTGTQILELKAKNSEPDLAASIANTYAENFIKECSSILPAGELSILDKAKVPANPKTPKVMLNTAVAFLIGLISSMGIAFLIEYCDTKIRTEEQIESMLHIPVLGIIQD